MLLLLTVSVRWLQFASGIQKILLKHKKDGAWKKELEIFSCNPGGVGIWQATHRSRASFHVGVYICTKMLDTTKLENNILQISDAR
jgi:hypothetical protein